MSDQIQVVADTPPGTLVEVHWRQDLPSIAVTPDVAYTTAGSPVVAWPRRTLVDLVLPDFGGGRRLWSRVLELDYVPRAVERTLRVLREVEGQIQHFLKIGVTREAAILHLFGHAEDQASLVQLSRQEAWEHGGLLGALGGVILGSGTAVFIGWLTRKR